MLEKNRKESLFLLPAEPVRLHPGNSGREGSNLHTAVPYEVTLLFTTSKLLERPVIGVAVKHSQMLGVHTHTFVVEVIPTQSVEHT